jgi:hypothetical protein
MGVGALLVSITTTEHYCLQPQDGLPHPQEPFEHIALQHLKRLYNPAHTKPNKKPLINAQPAIIETWAMVNGMSIDICFAISSEEAPDCMAHHAQTYMAIALVIPNANPNENGHIFFPCIPIPQDIMTLP